MSNIKSTLPSYFNRAVNQLRVTSLEYYLKHFKIEPIFAWVKSHYDDLRIF